MPARAERNLPLPCEKIPRSVHGISVWWDRSGFFDKYRERRIDTGTRSTLTMRFC